MSKAKRPSIEQLLEEALVPKDEQPYEVPGNWVWVRLGAIFEQEKEQIQPTGAEKYIGLEHLLSGGGIVEVGDTQGLKSKKVVFKKGDVLYGKLRPYLNKHTVVDFEGVASTDIIVFRSRYLVLNKLLDIFLGLPYVIKYANENSNGINLPRISPKAMSNLPFPLSPLNEQKRITDKIERLFAKIDEAKRLIEEVKESVELRRAAILDKAFKGQLGTNDPNEKSMLETSNDIKEKDLIPKEEQPYEVPENWVWVRSSHVAKWGSGGTPSRKKVEYYGGDIPWIKTGELNDGIVNTSEETITEEGLQNSSAKIFPKGSIVIAMYGATIGKLGILGIDAATNQACAVGQPHDFLNSKYMFYYFLARRSDLIALGKGGAQPNISQTIIKDFPFALPPLNEQKRIVERLDKLLGKLDEQEEMVLEVEKKLDLLKQSILNKAFRGELGTNDPNDEHAIELLKEALKSQ